MKTSPPSSEEQLQSLIGLGQFSARKSYYPELLSKIDELERLNRELEQRVQARTAELQHSLEVLKSTQSQLVESEKMAALGALVAGVAHEINTPLGTSITAISLAQDDLATLQQSYRDNRLGRRELEQTLETAIPALDSALLNLDRAAQLVSRFKAVAVDQRQLSLRRLRLLDYLEEAAEGLASLREASGVGFSLRGDRTLEIEIDPNSLTQILSQLVDNSLEHGFGGRPGQIAIEVRRQGDAVALCYRDDGRGIPPAIRKQIFDPFFTTQRGRGNTGLGLHFIYNLVTQQFGGSLRCESPGTGGALFTLTFPHRQSK